MIPCVVMDKENSKKLFIIQPPGYTYDFEPWLTKVEDHFDKILSILKILTPSGKSTQIKLNLELTSPEKYGANAWRESKESAIYKIKITSGLSYYLWTASRAFLYDETNLLPWIEKCIINDKLIKTTDKKLSKREIIANSAYFLSIYCVVLHEISHIILGHLDYLNDEMGLNYLSEFQEEKRDYSLEEIKIRKALEAEADRQAGELLLVFFEISLGSNGLGDYLSFPSRLHAYEFYIYAITSLFRVLQDITQREGIIHPKPNERLCNIFLGSLSKYFRQNFPEEHDEIYIHALKSCSKAGKQFTLVDCFDLLTIAQNALNLSFVDNVIEDINIRRYQHKVEFVNT